jgi:hypothetical protein
VEDFVYAGYDAINVLGRGLPVANADSHGATAVPGGSGEEGFSGGEDLCDDAVGECVVVGCGRAFARVFVRIVEADEALIDLRLPDEFGSFEGTDSGYECVRVVTGAFDQVGYALPAQLPEGGVGGESSAAAGPFGVPVHLVAGLRSVGEVRGAVGERGAMGLWIRYEGVSAVEWDVEPLVSVGCPGVSGVGSVEEVAKARGGGAPEAEGSVDVDPGAVLLRDGN